jgi:hypothetical protein
MGVSSPSGLMRRCLGVAGSRCGAREVGVGMVPEFAAEARGRRGEAAVDLVDERGLATVEELLADAEAFLGWILSGAVLRAGGTAGAGMTFFGGRRRSIIGLGSVLLGCRADFRLVPEADGVAFDGEDTLTVGLLWPDEVALLVGSEGLGIDGFVCAGGPRAGDRGLVDLSRSRISLTDLCQLRHPDDPNAVYSLA